MKRLVPPNTAPALRGMSVESLLAFAEALAAKHHDGHLICVRQTTCWQVTFGPPVSVLHHEDLEAVRRHKSLRQALVALISAELERRS